MCYILGMVCGQIAEGFIPALVPNVLPAGLHCNIRNQSNYGRKLGTWETTITHNSSALRAGSNVATTRSMRERAQKGDQWD